MSMVFRPTKRWIGDSIETIAVAMWNKAFPV
jgi:hypothetical protein